MNEFSYIYAASCSLLAVMCSVLFFIKKHYISKTGKIPPSPLKLPIIGHLHRIGRLPHRSLFSLSTKHGPLMLLHLGSKPVLIVSSARAAMEVFKTHEMSFADKGFMRSSKRIFYDGNDVVAAPYGDKWKKLRSILVNQLLHNRKVKSFSSIMEEETDILVQKIKLSYLNSSPLNLSDLFLLLTNNSIHRSAYGEKHSEGGITEKTIQGLADAADLVMKFSVGELIPWLSWIDELNGFNAAVERVIKLRDEIYGAKFQDLLERGHDSLCRESMGDILVRMYKGDTSGATIDEESVKALLLLEPSQDVSAAGTEVSAKSLEWAMSELLRHPEVMNKLQHEVRQILHGKHDITENDLDKMHYLKAVIKENFRCNPPLPLYPRESREYVNVMGYDIPEGTMVLINVWAINRDPAYWDEPQKFKPERFLNSSIDFKGSDYQYVPFGAGRRICPGLSFANASIERVLANLMHKFDWALPDGAKAQDLDMSELPGFAVGRKNPLIVLATKSYF